MEIWKEIEGYEGLYEVSNYGRVKSLERIAKWGVANKVIKDTILEPKANPYCRVGLRKDNTQKAKSVHRLVATAFIPNPNNYPLVMHIDDNPQNNHVSNLQWGTKAMNSFDMAIKGRARNQYTSIT
jgi:hypothetical protein